MVVAYPGPVYSPSPGLAFRTRRGGRDARPVDSINSEMIRASLGGVNIGDGLEVCVMGAINVSPESFYGRSVAAADDQLLAAASAMAKAGAGLVDIGAMSTAPYLDTAISAAEEADRLGRAVRLVASKVDVPVSADTSRAEPAMAALEAGARVINDVTGLRGDPGLAELVARTGAGLILMASAVSPRDRVAGERTSRPRSGAGPSSQEQPGQRAGGGMREEPADVAGRMLAESLCLAFAGGVQPSAVAVDPGIGFFRAQGMSWYEWDCRALATLRALRRLGRPICVGVSRKSFIGAVTGQSDPADRLPGSLAAAAAAVLGGAHVVRTHDVAETVQAVRVASAIQRARRETACQ
jgi:dihydropteroate synthase